MAGQNRRTDALAADLAGRILTGLWPEGEKIPSDAAIGAEFGVSRTVVREAFRLLSAKGLLQARPRLGTIAAPRQGRSLIDADMLDWLEACGELAAYLDDMTDLRLAMEPSFAALAAARADASGNQALQTALRALQEHPEADAETAFITVFFAICGNRLAGALAPLAAMAIKHRAAPPPLAAYARMTAAIAQKDGVAARQAAFQAIIDA